MHFPQLTIGKKNEPKGRNKEQADQAQRALELAASTLSAGGWDASTSTKEGTPLRDLLATVASERADLLVVGARGKSVVDNLLIGSVADGALTRSRVPVLIVR